MADQESTATGSDPKLNLSDLVAALQILQAAADRKAFSQEELVTVSALYKRIFNFLEQSGAIEKLKAAQAEASANSENQSTEGNQS